ncbi:MAG: caspase family protein [Bacteroidota bacterium]
MRCFFLLFGGLCLSSPISAQQELDLSGTWNGTSYVLGQPIHMLYELEQAGKHVSGTVLSINANNSKDSVLYTVEGSLDRRSLELRGIDIESSSKEGTSCMAATHKLFYDEAGGQGILNGKWKGSVNFNTCPPLMFGSVALYRQNNSTQIADGGSIVTRSVATTMLHDEDDVGEALVNELKSNRYIALMIGIDTYNDNEIEDLDHPISDASKLADALQQFYTFDDVTLLKNPTRQEIIQSLDELASRVQPKDNLLIFYAGHGIWNEQLRQGYWLPKDAAKDSKAQWLSNSTIRDYVGGINAKHTLLISDACFSGGILRERGIYNNSRAMLELYKLPSRKAMTSGTLNTVPDKSVFMQYLLKNLKQNQELLISADQLFRSFKTAVINNSPNGQVPQYGPIVQSGDEGGDFIFLRKR